MLFTSMTFLWIFLPVVFVLYRLVKDLKLRNVILFAAGLVFYVWGSAPRDIPVFVLLIIFNYAAGLMIGKERFDPNKDVCGAGYTCSAYRCDNSIRTGSDTVPEVKGCFV